MKRVLDAPRDPDARARDTAALHARDRSDASAHGIAPVAPHEVDSGLDVVALPGDHPQWQRDVVSISSRTRALIVTLRPIVVRVKTFWDHAVRSVGIGSRRLEIDPSGSYRLR